MEVLKAGASTFEEAGQIALRIDSAIWGATKTESTGSPHGTDVTPMEIGNMEGRSRGEHRRQYPMDAQRIKTPRTMLVSSVTNTDAGRGNIRVTFEEPLLTILMSMRSQWKRTPLITAIPKRNRKTSWSFENKFSPSRRTQ